MKKRLLLISNSTNYHSGYLDHCEKEIIDFLGKIKEIVFIPYASHDENRYAEVVLERFSKMNISLESIHVSASPIEVVRNARALFVGGGNTFLLLKKLQENNLISIITQRVEKEGMLYIGSSAGTNVACPTIKTTNDMPIIQPQTFNALELVPFQINPHYYDSDAGSEHMGETREQRILEFLQENNTPVVGLREGAMLRLEGETIQLKGTSGARLFIKGKQAKEYSAESKLNFLL